MKLVITSGYYDPLHVGHLECFEEAKKLGDRLLVIVNNDHQASLKKGTRFMPHDDRLKLVQALGCVDETFLALDTDKTVCESLEYVFRRYAPGYSEVIFAKGGDRFNDEVPEANTCEALGITMVDGLGAKIRSSSELTEVWRNKISKQRRKDA